VSRSDLQLPNVEELTAAGKAGRFDDRLEDYLPDAYYIRKPVPTTRVKRPVPRTPRRTTSNPVGSRVLAK
jgi:hypothetical protein